jgi:hypothetical protein
MNNACTIHEGFMSDYRTILPRVGGGVGVGVGGGFRGSIQDQSCYLKVGGALRAIGIGSLR